MSPQNETCVFGCTFCAKHAGRLRSQGFSWRRTQWIFVECTTQGSRQVTNTSKCIQQKSFFSRRTLRSSRWRLGPTPDSMRRCGDPTVPALRITSRAASTRFRRPSCTYSTPAALSPEAQQGDELHGNLVKCELLFICSAEHDLFLVCACCTRVDKVQNDLLRPQVCRWPQPPDGPTYQMAPPTIKQDFGDVRPGQDVQVGSGPGSADVGPSRALPQSSEDVRWRSAPPCMKREKFVTCSGGKTMQRTRQCFALQMFTFLVSPVHIHQLLSHFHRCFQSRVGQVWNCVRVGHFHRPLVPVVVLVWVWNFRVRVCEETNKPMLTTRCRGSGQSECQSKQNAGFGPVTRGATRLKDRREPRGPRLA